MTLKSSLLGPLNSSAVFTFLVIALLSGAQAAQIDIIGPVGSGSFGTNVILLPNGNFVVTDPGYNAPGPVPNVGAVYLYDGSTLSVISTLTGSAANDAIGNRGVTVLSNGNFAVNSMNWNGSRGAVTWGGAVTGASGVVSPANSLVGSTANDMVGNGGVTALANGNFVVRSFNWDNGVVVDAGAVTWCNGLGGTVGVVSPANSLVGSTASDTIGNGSVTALTNGNYVVRSFNWDNGVVVNAGAVTWGSGMGGTTGAVSAINSLVGTTANDQVSAAGMTVLNNGNYVVISSSWNSSRGAVTWVSGASGLTGAVSAANSFVGGGVSDLVGNAGVVALNNGNYVVSSPSWKNGSASSAGAVTLCDGAGNTVGVVSLANSLIGSTANDRVGDPGVVSLSNGNYVVMSKGWNGARGAATLGNGLGGTVGVVSSVNSLVGTKVNDNVGTGVTALSNGNYVVRSFNWDNGAVTDVGAVTWGSGTSGVTGVVSTANSLVGSVSGDLLGNSGVVALNNGNYVVASMNWDNGGAVDAGAVTWGNGSSGTVGAVSPANSLVGTTASDSIGNGGVIALNNGNYVVRSFNWDNDAAVNAGAVTWGNGLGGTVGAVSAGNSLVGATANDGVASFGVTTLINGDYVVRAPNWDNGTMMDVGAVTWGNGLGGTVGPVTPANSLIGGTASDGVGNNVPTVLTNGNYLVRNPPWDNGAVVDAGAVTMFDGSEVTSGVVNSTNSILGTVAGGGGSMVYSFDYLNSRLVVGCPRANLVSLLAFAPEISVERPASVNIAHGGLTSFGGVISGEYTNLTFTIKNTGNADLTGLGMTIDGADASTFTVAASPAAPVSGPSGSTTFTVRFTPTTAGVKTAALRIASNDSDENPFDIALTGTGLTTSAAWRQINFGNQANSGDGADLNDYEHDGIVNFVEYAFGLDPKQNSSGQLPKAQIIGGNLVTSFTQPVDVTGFTYGAEWSSTLLPGSWTAISDSGLPPQHIFSVPVAAYTNLFMRLTVTNP